jgi:hypothetical protein
VSDFILGLMLGAALAFAIATRHLPAVRKPQ